MLGRVVLVVVMSSTEYSAVPLGAGALPQDTAIAIQPPIRAAWMHFCFIILMLMIYIYFIIYSFVPIFFEKNFFRCKSTVNLHLIISFLRTMLSLFGTNKLYLCDILRLFFLRFLEKKEIV